MSSQRAVSKSSTDILKGILAFLPKGTPEKNVLAIQFISPGYFDTVDNYPIEGVEEDKKSKMMFVKSRVNKMEESYKSPYSQEYFPTPIPNMIIPLNITKVEKGLNSLLQHYCHLMYLNGFTSSVFFSDYTQSHNMYFFIRKDLKENEWVKGGYYQMRCILDVYQKDFSRSGYLEYFIELKDYEGSRRTIEGKVFKDEERKNKTEGVLDVRNFNFREAGVLFTKLETTFYRTVFLSLLKARPGFTEETRLTPRESESRDFSRSVISSLKSELGKRAETEKRTGDFYKSVGSIIMAPQKAKSMLPT